MAKKIIERHLPLTEQYTLVAKKYIPFSEGSGVICDNCHRYIARIATIQGKETKKGYNIGFDCLETILIANKLLDKLSVVEYKRVKPMFDKIIRIGNKLKGILNNNPTVTGLLFEREQIGRYITFYYLHGSETKSRNNDIVEFNDIDFDLFIDVLGNMMGNIRILKDG